MFRSRGLPRIVKHWVFKLLDHFHNVVASFRILLDIILNAFQQLAELCGVTGCSYVKDLILELSYLTFVAGFCCLIAWLLNWYLFFFPTFAVFA
jgi:hypothetical protein